VLRYALDIGLPEAPREPWALLVPSVRMNVAVALRGEPLGAAPPPERRDWMRPLLFTMPASLLRAGANRVDLVVHADAAGRGYLGAPLVGPAALLAPHAERRLFAQQTLARLNVGLTGVVAVLMLLLWLLRRRDTVYALYGCGMLLWGLHNLNFVVADPPWPAHWWETAAYILLGGFIALGTRFVHRYLGTRRERLERAVAIAIGAGALTLLLLPADAARRFGDLAWNPLVMTIGLYMCLHTHACAGRSPDPLLQVLAANGTLVVLFGVHDLLISVGLQPWGSGYLLHYSATVSLIVFTALLIVRFAQGLAAVERANDELSLRVDAAVRQREDAQARMRALERARWLGAERERIARDMHDGVGGHLVALLARARTGRLAPHDTEAALSNALEDLRLAIDSLEVDEGDLPTALAKFRHRLERRLRDTPIRLLWQAGEAPGLAGYGPAEILQVLRILDEAATNVLRHAAASTITIGYRGTAEGWQLVVTDDGSGGVPAEPAGHGLRNMHRRAAAIGATLEVDSRPSGTRLTLHLRQRESGAAAQAPPGDSRTSGGRADEANG
jgi:signal transduction histidine kinase